MNPLPDLIQFIFSPQKLGLVVLTSCAILSGCDKSTAQQNASGDKKAAPPPAEVGVVVVSTQAVALQTELPGRIEPLRVAQVRARVNGIVQKRLFEEGSEVKEGQALFRIDPSLYQAALASAEATLGKAQANFTQAKEQAERYKPLVEANAVSKQDYINVVAAQKQAEADIAAGKAAVQTARINLGYANVTAPISGRIGRTLVTEGALVSQGEATQLALIQQTNQVYVNFTQSATELMRLRAQARKSADAQADSSKAALPVSVVTEDGLPRRGKLLFSDITVDPTSGQVLLRALVPNSDGMLLPGQYVRVRISQTKLDAAILLPQQAVTRSQQGDSVLIIGPENKPMPRPVKVGLAEGNNWVVLEGLQPGEQVIVDGFQKMAPGAAVKPVQWQPLANTNTNTTAKSGTNSNVTK